MQPIYFSRPDASEHGPGFGRYIALVAEGDVIAILEEQLADVSKLLGGMSEAEAMTVHAPYAWTIKQVVGHMTDCERVFGFRALWIARNDKTALPSFDENAFMQFSTFNAVSMGELAGEFELVRRGHIAMFRHFAPDAWLRAGTVGGHAATPRAFLYAIAGHAKHHLDILHARLKR